MDDAISYYAQKDWPETSGLWLIRRSDKDGLIIGDLDRIEAINLAGLLNEAFADGAEMARGRVRDALGLPPST